MADTLIEKPPRTKPSEPRRRPTTADELHRMIEVGIIDHEERVELIAGDIIAMAAKGNRHELVRNELTTYFGDHRPRAAKFAAETPLRLSPTDEPEPDFIFYPSDLKSTAVDGASVLLVIEVADTSLGYDLGFKSRVYAAFGVVEYWVIDAEALRTHVHRHPSPNGYGTIDIVEAAGRLTTPFGLSLALSDLDI